MTKTKKLSRMRTEILEIAAEMQASGTMDQATYDKITRRDQEEPVKVPAVTGEDIRAMREQAHMSQAVFAQHLNLTADYLSKLERGAHAPTGPALVLLNVIKRKGLNVLLG